jgi:hypothetical protein
MVVHSSQVAFRLWRSRSGNTSTSQLSSLTLFRVYRANTYNAGVSVVFYLIGSIFLLLFVLKDILGALCNAACRPQPVAQTRPVVFPQLPVRAVSNVITRVLSVLLHLRLIRPPSTGLSFITPSTGLPFIRPSCPLPHFMLSLTTAGLRRRRRRRPCPGPGHRLPPSHSPHAAPHPPRRHAPSLFHPHGPSSPSTSPCPCPCPRPHPSTACGGSGGCSHAGRGPRPAIWARRSATILLGHCFILGAPFCSRV